MRHDSPQQPSSNVGHWSVKRKSQHNGSVCGFGSFETYNWPKWLILQFRNHVLEECISDESDTEGRQVLSATFLEAVRELLSVRMNALARKFHEPHDIVVKDELEDLLKEYGNLKGHRYS